MSYERTGQSNDHSDFGIRGTTKFCGSNSAFRDLDKAYDPFGLSLLLPSPSPFAHADAASFQLSLLTKRSNSIQSHRWRRMSIFRWVFLAIVAYFAHSLYQRIQYSRKKAEFIRDRRRAAGIPDDDNRPFAVARADALSRRSQQLRDEALSTPVKRSRNIKASNSQASIDREAALRLSGIPGTLPGYLKDSTISQEKRGNRYAQSNTVTSQSTRSPSPIKHRDSARSSPTKTMKRQHSQTQVEASPSTKRSPYKDVREDSPSARRDAKRPHRVSPTEADGPEQGMNGADRRKAQKVCIPGDFDGADLATDEDMSDVPPAPSETSEAPSTAMDEDEDVSASRTTNTGKAKRTRDSPLKTLQTSARSTAKKREADELDDSDIEGSIDTLDDDEHAHSQAHSSKRSRTANRDLDPSSALDFDIALPEVAMADFNPTRDPPTSSTKTKRHADTSDDRQPGEEWTDYEGLKWRIDPHTHELQRWTPLLESRPKYRMPKDSLHPMAKESHQVIVHKWLTKDEWEDAKSRKLLSFQEPERLAEKERLDKEEAEKMRRKQELLAKIRETSSPNKRIQSYLAQRQLQHKLSDVSMTSVTEGGGDMSLDSSSVFSAEGGTPGKPRSRRVALGSRMTPSRGDVSGSNGVASGPSDSPRRSSPFTSPYRSIAYPKKKGTPAQGSPLVGSFAQSNGADPASS